MDEPSKEQTTNGSKEVEVVEQPVDADTKAQETKKPGRFGPMKSKKMKKAKKQAPIQVESDEVAVVEKEVEEKKQAEKAELSNKSGEEKVAEKRPPSDPKLKTLPANIKAELEGSTPQKTPTIQNTKNFLDTFKVDS